MGSLYKVLGTTAKASEKTIKKRYIERVKEFPPETHPEEFQNIRLAYDTLKDPDKRNKYDVQRLYGSTPQEVLEKASEYMNKGEPEKAKDLLEKALSMDPKNAEVHTFLGFLYLVEEEFEEFEKHFSEAYTLVPEKFKVGILVKKATLSLSNEEPELALDALNKLKALHPEDVDLYIPLFFKVYEELGMEEELWNLAQERVDQLPANTWEAAHWPDYLNWIHALIETQNWSLKSKVMGRVKKYLKNVQFDEEKEDEILEDLWEFYEDALDNGQYKIASVFLDLLKLLQPKDPDLLEETASFKKEKQLNEEIHRLSKDSYIYPPVIVEVLKTYLDDYFPEQLDYYIESIPPNLYEMFDPDEEDFAISLALLKKKYKGIYHEYKEKWDALFEEKQSNLSRRERRRIKY